jgi:hypothetical protein
MVLINEALSPISISLIVFISISYITPLLNLTHYI